MDRKFLRCLCNDLKEDVTIGLIKRKDDDKYE